MEAPPGIVCALVTPFRKDGAVDEPALRELIDFQAERGVDALFVLGTTGEGVLLEAAERRRATEVAADHLRGRLPLVVHCGAADTLTAAALARHAEEAGAVASAAVVPFFFHYTDAELYRHFAAIAEAAPRIGHYLYENPERVGYSAGVGLVARLVDEVPGILGVKDTGDSIGKLGRYLASPGTPIQVYTGSNLTVLPALMMGARGAVSALANAAPELLVEINRAWREGDLPRARRLQLALTRLQACLDGLPYIAAIKHLVERRGPGPGQSRPPQALLDAGQRATLDRRLAADEELGAWLDA
jgi:dihydrodipicolinate synthase/N-acetylneuraminate lyase